MSDFYSPQERRTARKAHQCTYCAEPIAVGDEYVFQKGNYDCHWYENKMHPECFEELCCEGEGEFTPYSNERRDRHAVNLCPPNVGNEATPAAPVK